MTGNEPGYEAPDISLVGEEHIRRYRETDGEVGYLWNGVPTLLLTTTGRRSGEPRTAALRELKDNVLTYLRLRRGTFNNKIIQDKKEKKY